MKRLSKFILFGLLPFNLGCEIKDFVAPSWDITANIPIINEAYIVHKILEGQSNYYIDSVDNNVVLHTNFEEKIEVEKGLEYEGYSSKGNLFLLNSDTILYLEFDDSIFVKNADFREGQLTITFFNHTNEQYEIEFSILNLKNKSSNQPLKFNGTVKANSSRVFQSSLVYYYIDNGGILSNIFEFKIISSSPMPFTIAMFDYNLTRSKFKNIVGKFKPTYSYENRDTVFNPLGDNAPDAPFELAVLKKSDLIIKNYADSDIKLFDVHIRGVNTITNTSVTLKYDYNNNGFQDSLITFELQKRGNMQFSETLIRLTSQNSNLRQFISNAPNVIYFDKNFLVNEYYREVSLNYRDSIVTEFDIEIPLRFRLDDYLTYNDTNFTSLSIEQRDELSNSQGVNFKSFILNAIALDLKIKVSVQDENGNNLLILTRNIANQSGDSFAYLPAAQVDAEGNVIPGGEGRLNLGIILNREEILDILDFQRVVVEVHYKTASGANFVRVRGEDFLIFRSEAEIIYRVNS